MPDPFYVSIYVVIVVPLFVAALWTRDGGEHRADAAMTLRAFADAATAASSNLDGNPLRSSAWQAPRDRGAFQDLEAALCASYAARFDQGIRTIRAGPPGSRRRPIKRRVSRNSRRPAGRRRTSKSSNQSEVIMTHRLSLGLGSALAIALCLGAMGCSRRPAEGRRPAASIPVSYPVERYVTDYADFTARTAAVDSVEARARVWGYLEKVNFKEGALVKNGDVLFELDPRPYQALLNQAKAKVAQDEAQLKFDEAEFQRNLQARAVAVSRSDLEKSAAARDVDIANVAADKSAVASRQLDLDYTKVTRAGQRARQPLRRHGGQPGAVGGPERRHPAHHHRVGGSDVRLLRRGRAAPSSGSSSSPARARSRRPTRRPCRCRWAWKRRRGFPTRARSISWTTRSTRRPVRSASAVCSPKDEALSQGYFARVRMPIGTPHPALLVYNRALTNDQGQKVLYVVNDKNEVVSRPLRVGALHDGLREITDGLKPGERVIVNGLLQVRPGAVVEPKLVDMPTPEVTKPNGAAAVAKATP